MQLLRIDLPNVTGLPGHRNPSFFSAWAQS
jgi:hypothetical protein